MLASELESDSSRSPVSMGATHFQHHRLHFRRHLMRAMCWPRRPIAETLQAVALIASQPAVHRLPTDARFTRDLAHRPAVGNYRQNRFVPLLSHAHLPHGRGASRRYRSSCSKPAEGLSHSSRRRLVAYEPNLHTEIGSGVGIRTLNLAVNRSARPVQKSRFLFA